MAQGKRDARRQSKRIESKRAFHFRSCRYPEGGECTCERVRTKVERDMFSGLEEG